MPVKKTQKKTTSKSVKAVKKQTTVENVPSTETQAVSAPQMHHQILLSWVAPEYDDHSRGRAWYVIACVVLIGVIFYSLTSGSWSTAVVFVLFAGVYLMNMQHKPRNIGNAITALGIQHGKNFHTFSQIEGFWIIYHPPMVNVLHLKLMGKNEYVSIQLGDQSPVIVRNLLSHEIPEIEGRGEPVINYITRVLKL